MTRKEEIKQAAFNNDRESSKENQQYFIEGAEWSDENPDEKMVSLEKVIDYLKRLTYQEYAGGPMVRMLDDYEIYKFKKFMKGE